MFTLHARPGLAQAAAIPARGGRHAARVLLWLLLWFVPVVALDAGVALRAPEPSERAPWRFVVLPDLHNAEIYLQDWPGGGLTDADTRARRVAAAVDVSEDGLRIRRFALAGDGGRLDQQGVYARPRSAGHAGPRPGRVRTTPVCARPVRARPVQTTAVSTRSTRRCPRWPMTWPRRAGGSAMPGDLG